MGSGSFSSVAKKGGMQDPWWYLRLKHHKWFLVFIYLLPALTSSPISVHLPRKTVVSGILAFYQHIGYVIAHCSFLFVGICRQHFNSCHLSSEVVTDSTLQTDITWIAAVSINRSISALLSPCTAYNISTMMIIVILTCLRWSYSA